MANPYDYQPEVKWYNILWDMRNKEFRQWYIRKSKKDFRIFWKYDRRRVTDKVLGGFVLAAILMYLCGTDTASMLLRWPTDDVNELLKQGVWQRHKNELNARKEHVNKLLEESNYMNNKNNPSK